MVEDIEELRDNKVYPKMFSKLSDSDLPKACHLYMGYLIALRLSRGPDTHRAHVWTHTAFNRRCELISYLQNKLNQYYTQEQIPK